MKKLSFEGIRVLVLGDVMLDRYLYGQVNRVSPEAPVPILNFSHTELKLGGAANVALNLKALGAEVTLVSVTGDDKYGEQIRKLVQKEGFHTDHIYADTDRKTTVKTRIIGGGQQLMRIDEEDVYEISDEMMQRFKDKIALLFKEDNIEILIIQDYNKGLLSKELIRNSIKLAHEQGIFIAVDPKEKNFFEYKKVDLFKPNLKEMTDAIKFDIAPDLISLSKANDILKVEISNRFTLISLSEYGVFIARKEEILLVPTTTIDIVDVCGAGDAVLCIATLGLFRGMSLKETAMVSNMAGGIVCENQGVYPISIDELKKAYTKKTKK